MSSRGFLAEGAASAKALRQRLSRVERGASEGMAQEFEDLWHLVQPRSSLRWDHIAGRVELLNFIKGLPWCLGVNNPPVIQGMQVRSLARELRSCILQLRPIQPSKYINKYF